MVSGRGAKDACERVAETAGGFEPGVQTDPHGVVTLLKLTPGASDVGRTLISLICRSEVLSEVASGPRRVDAHIPKIHVVMAGRAVFLYLRQKKRYPRGAPVVIFERSTRYTKTGTVLAGYRAALVGIYRKMSAEFVILC